MDAQRETIHHYAPDAQMGAIFREEQYLHTIRSEKRHELLFAPYGVSFSEFRTMMYLIDHPDGVEPSKIADDLLILRQTMTHIVDSLQKNSLAERIPHPNDRRRICIRLLPKGREIAHTLFQIESEYSARVYQHFTEEEGQMYRYLVRKMSTAKEEELDRILAERQIEQL